MNQYTLTEETINKVLQYLATRPYAEVVQLINAVGQAKLVQSATAEAAAPQAVPAETQAS